MRNCYLSRNYKDINGAGNKAKTDIERIMSESGYVNVGFRQTRYTNTVLAFLVTLASVLKVPLSLKCGDRLVVQEIFYFCMPDGSSAKSESDRGNTRSRKFPSKEAYSESGN